MEKIIKLNDAFGQPLQKGDYITYPVRQSSNMWLSVMRIDEIVEKIVDEYILNRVTREYDIIPKTVRSINGHVISSYQCWVKDSTGGHEFVQEDFPAKFIRNGLITDNIISSLNANGIKIVKIIYPKKTTVRSLDRVIKLPNDCDFDDKLVLKSLTPHLIF